MQTGGIQRRLHCTVDGGMEPFVDTASNQWVEGCDGNAGNGAALRQKQPLELIQIFQLQGDLCQVVEITNGLFVQVVGRAPVNLDKKAASVQVVQRS